MNTSLRFCRRHALHAVTAGFKLKTTVHAWSWLHTVNHFYKTHHKLIEKYHIASSTPREGGGGEYPLQDGFGWTNGVVRRLIGLYGEP